MPTDKQYLNPTGGGPCITGSVGIALLYLALRTIREPGFAISHLVDNKGLLELAQQVAQTTDSITNINEACRIIYGKDDEPFIEKEKRITLAIKAHAHEKGLYHKLANQRLALIEKGFAKFDIKFWALPHSIDIANTRAYQNLLTYLETEYDSTITEIPYADFGLTREQVITGLTNYFFSYQGYLPAHAIKDYIELYGGDSVTQSFLDGTIVSRGGGDPEFEHLDPLHQYLYLPKDKYTKELIKRGAKPELAPEEYTEETEEEMLQRILALSRAEAEAAQDKIPAAAAGRDEIVSPSSGAGDDVKTDSVAVSFKQKHHAKFFALGLIINTIKSNDKVPAVSPTVRKP